PPPGPGSMSVRRHQRDWEELAEVDPLWAVLSDPARRGGRWQLDEFLATGEADAERVLRVAGGLGRPARRGRVLDFGCGVGRVTRALAAHFEEAVGVDLSARMVEQARRLHADVPNCRFETLSPLEEGAYDLVYSRIVLQHLPRARDALGYVDVFLRAARPDGLVVFQLPDAIPRRRRLGLRRRAYGLLRALGVSPRRLHARGLSPIRVIGVAREEVERFLAARGATVALAEPDDAVAGLASFQYYVLPRPATRS
ncbi:MAG: class I SAM-dependent methyltransferase, partial [Gaiellaceae bacterium]